MHAPWIAMKRITDVYDHQCVNHRCMTFHLVSTIVYTLCLQQKLSSECVLKEMQ